MIFKLHAYSEWDCIRGCHYSPSKHLYSMDPRQGHVFKQLHCSEPLIPILHVKDMLYFLSTNWHFFFSKCAVHAVHVHPANSRLQAHPLPPPVLSWSEAPFPQLVSWVTPLRSPLKQLLSLSASWLNVCVGVL